MWIFLGRVIREILMGVMGDVPMGRWPVLSTLRHQKLKVIDLRFFPLIHVNDSPCSHTKGFK